MKRIGLLCIVLAASIAYSVSGQDYLYQTYETYYNQGRDTQYKTLDGFRLDVNGGVAFLLSDIPGPAMKADKVGYYFGITPTYVMRSEQDALGVDIMQRFHSYDHTTLNSKVDLNMFIVGPRYTWIARPSYRGSLFFDVGMFYVFIKEKGRKIILNNKIDTWGGSASVGYSLRVHKRVKMVFKLSGFVSVYEAHSGLYDRSRSLSSINLSTGFWLFR